MKKQTNISAGNEEKILFGALRFVEIVSGMLKLLSLCRGLNPTEMES